MKNADQMSFGEIEKQIVKLSSKAKEGSLTMDDLSGGTLQFQMVVFMDRC